MKRNSASVMYREGQSRVSITQHTKSDSEDTQLKSLFSFLFFKNFIYLFLEREREREREGDKHWPVNQAHALTRN